MEPDALLYFDDVLQARKSLGADIAFEVRDKRRGLERRFFTGDRAILQAPFRLWRRGLQPCLDVGLILPADVQSAAQAGEPGRRYCREALRRSLRAGAINAGAAPESGLFRFRLFKVMQRCGEQGTVAYSTDPGIDTQNEIVRHIQLQ